MSSSKRQQYCIEVGAGGVKVVRVDSKGKIIGKGFARISGDANGANKAWIEKLSRSIKEAAKEAKVPRGANFPCSVVTYGSNVIMQHFNLPEMNHQAMLDNAKHEISAYLPGALSQFVISAEVQKKSSTMDVFIAAIPRDIAIAISTAVTWAGFRIMNFDISENARIRLVNEHCFLGGGKPDSYGILDFCSAEPSISLYLNGCFYSTHYFSEDATVIDVALREISYVVDFVKYQERSSKLECILIMGETTPEFAQNLSVGLDIPVYSQNTWLMDYFKGIAKNNASIYLDAYAAGIPSEVVGLKQMLDLKTAPMLKNPRGRLAVIAAASFILMFSALAYGIYIPFINEQNLQADYNDLDYAEERITRFIASVPSEEIVDTLQESLNLYETRLDGIDNFYSEFVQAGTLIPIIFHSGFTEISNVNVMQDVVSIGVNAIEFNHVADILENLRSHPLFAGANTSSIVERDTSDRETGTASFNTSIRMNRGMGRREW
ncbi:MAG: hypothetical protein FWF81_08680 [Defluviitaleaceae bacterium]|nr:hypothetical protein [Defluviitaleaceae bacterium]